jgi:TolB-like protein/DNA-binding winged helix-turn-helix (wHTH) protein/Flp pilus assembly protein TadD
VAAPSTNGGIIRFGPFQMDLAAREVRREGRKVKLQEQPFRVLTLLLQRPGQVVTREELQQALWPVDTFVEFDRGLNTAIKKIRQALGDSAGTPELIETLPRQGYRFIGSVAVESDQVAPCTLRVSRMRIAVLAGAGILTIGLSAFWVTTIVRRAPPSSELSIAVLPFTNLSADPENEYFAHGLREELIQALSKVEQLRVIKSAGRAEDIPEISRKLKVRAVLAGSVRKSGESLRIAANLIDPGDGHLLWSEAYDREFKDVFTIQEQIARAIVETLDLRLAGAQGKRLVRDSSVNLEAYSLYLKGRYALNTANDIEGTKKAMRYFEQAIAKDGSYAPAYAGLGDSYDVLCDLEALPPVEGLAGRRKAAQKALELDPTLPEAIATRGGVAVEDWDWPTAERCFKRAIELKPNDTTTHCWYGLVLAGLGRYDEAVTEAKRAKELDPLFQDDGLMGQILYWARHYDKALEHSRKILERHPSAPCAHGLIGPIYLLQGAKEPALAELARAAELSGHTSSAESCLGQAFAMCGRKIEAQQILQALITKSKDHYVGSLNIARIYAGLGDRDRAFEWLDKAYRKYESEWPLALADPMWDTLRSDPRFAALLKRIGLRS